MLVPTASLKSSPSHDLYLHHLGSLLLASLEKLGLEEHSSAPQQQLHFLEPSVHNSLVLCCFSGDPPDVIHALLE